VSDPASSDTGETMRLPDDLDALSDVLHAIHLRGDDVYRRVAGERIVHDEQDGARAIYLVERGRLRLTMPDARHAVDEGGLALVARGLTHRLEADAGTVWITGTFAVEERRADPVLRVLPSAIVLSSGERTSPWLDVALALIVGELVEPHPGGRVMVSRLLDLLFIRTLREWAPADKNAVAGILTATMDPAIARVLTAIHRDPGRAWTVEALARRAQLSRSAFAARFAMLIGDTPGRYVARQRLAHAERLVRETDLPLRIIAADTGYESAAAFSRAFSRAYGESPRGHRARPFIASGSAAQSPTSE
jgi:AraC-like DNA-binding protein